MRKLIYIILVAAFFSSCEKVIDIELKDSEKKFVVDAYINNVAGESVIRLSYSSNYFEVTEIETVSGAIVRVFDENNNESVFTESENGYYSNPDFMTLENSTYELKIDHQTGNYSSKSYCPDFVTLDSIKVTESEFGFGGDKSYRVNCYFDDPAGIDNYYRLKLFVNDEEQKGFYLTDDMFFNGLTINYTFNGLELEEGDLISVDLQCVDANVYDYFYTLSRVTGMGDNVIPGNPLTNIEGGAIGIFNASTLSSLDRVFKIEEIEE